jgi:hypothetical protein
MAGPARLTATTAPAFDLRGVNGGRRTLAVLRMMGQPILLVFVDDPSVPYSPLLAEVARLQADPACDVTILLVGSGEVRVDRQRLSAHGVRNVAMDHEGRVRRAYDCMETPSAVLIGVDGRIARDVVHGARAVRQLLDDARDPGRRAGAVVHGSEDVASREVVTWLDVSAGLTADAEETETLQRYRTRPARSEPSPGGVPPAPW